MSTGRDLADLTGLAERTLRAAVARLQDRGLVRRGNRSVWLTDAGRSEVGAGIPGVSLTAALDAAIACLPAEALRAYVRLQLSAVVARHHLAACYDSAWPGFVTCGGTGTGKTTMSWLVCRIFGFDPLIAIVEADIETKGSLLIRRERDRTSTTGWRAGLSQALRLPFMLIDEYDKATPEVRKATGVLLMGNSAAYVEGSLVEIRPIIAITLNTGRQGLAAVHQAYRRRSVVLNTDPLGPLLDDIDLARHQLQNGKVAIPRLSLDRLRPPAQELPDELRELMRGELRAGLTEEGRALTDIESLTRIALGRAALPDGDLEQAVLATVYDYLSCAETLGQARDGFAARLAPRLGAGMLLPDPDAAQDERQQLFARRLEREMERALDGDRLVEERAYLERMVDEAIAMLDLRKLKICSPQQRMAVWSLAERLRKVRADITSARTREALQAAVETRLREPLQRAGELHQEIEREAAIRRDTAARLAPVSRSRRPELALTRTAWGLLREMLPGAHGAELEVIEQRSKQLAEQLEAAPPWTEAKRQRDIAALSMRQVQNANWNPANYG